MPWKTVWSAEGDQLQRYDNADAFGGKGRLRRWIRLRERVLRQYVDACGLAAVFIPTPGVDPQVIYDCITDPERKYRFVLQEYEFEVRVPEPGKARRKPAKTAKKTK